MLHLNILKASISEAAIELTTHWRAVPLAMMIVVAIVGVIAGIMMGSPAPILIAPATGGSGGGG